MRGWHEPRSCSPVKQSRFTLVEREPVMLTPITLTLALLLCSLLIALAYMAIDERA